jgi:hypothetical protein
MSLLPPAYLSGKLAQPLPTKDGGVLRTIGAAAKLILEQADGAAVSHQVNLAHDDDVALMRVSHGAALQSRREFPSFADSNELRAKVGDGMKGLVGLLSAMSRALGYDFSDEELRRGIYYPKGHGDREQTQQAILTGLGRILRGEDSFRMKITEAPGSAEAAKLQAQLTEKMVTAYDAGGALRVRILTESTEPTLAPEQPRRT